MQEVSLESRDALKIIRTTDHSKDFFYCDPPYYNSDMAHYDGYTIEDFKMLLKALSSIEGKFLLSSYPSDLLQKYTKDNQWNSVRFNKHVAVSNKGKRKIEVLTANYPLKTIS
ncbi:MAG: DNA adenine methylase [Bacteroidota bacterium]|nr:DNA adenine methylase [Bacteroidota bacterium]